MSADINTLYAAWRQRPGPGTLTPLIQALDPVISSAMTTYGFKDDVGIKNKLRLYVADHLDSYDPSKGTTLSSYVHTVLKRTPRIGYRSVYSIPMPERVSYDIMSIKRTEEELRDSLGRDPNDDELADAAGISGKRLAALRRTYMVPEYSQSTLQDADGGRADFGHQQGPDLADSVWFEAVYSGLDPVNKRIADWSFGRNNQPVLPKTEIARRLKMSPSAVTQRAMRISQQFAGGPGGR